MNNLNNIFWHDCEIESVMEIPKEDKIIFNILYPENWEKNEFLSKSIIFEDFYLYEIDEIPFEGNPTILSVELISKQNDFFTIKMETNAGCRIITAKKVFLSKQVLSS